MESALGVTLQVTVKFRLYMRNIMYWGLLTLNIISFFSLFSLACASSKTYNLQSVFLRIYDTNWGKSCQAFLAETVETWKKNRCMIDWPRMLCEETLNLELSRNVSVHEFYRFKALISLEQVNTSKWAEKKKQSWLTKLRWSGVINFHCMQMAVVMQWLKWRAM